MPYKRKLEKQLQQAISYGEVEEEARLRQELSELVDKNYGDETAVEMDGPGQQEGDNDEPVQQQVDQANEVVSAVLGVPASVLETLQGPITRGRERQEREQGSMRMRSGRLVSRQQLTAFTQF